MPGKKFIKKGKKTKGLGKTKSTTTYGKGGATKKKKYKVGGTPVIGPLTEEQAAAQAASLNVRPPYAIGSNVEPGIERFVGPAATPEVTPDVVRKAQPGNIGVGVGTPGRPTPAEQDAIEKEKLIRELSTRPTFNKTLGGKVYNAKKMRQGGFNIRNRRKNR